MTDEKMYKLLEKFANDHSLAVGGNIKVTINENFRSFKPRDPSRTDTMKLEDTMLLGDIIRGAENYLFWSRRSKNKD